MKMLGFADDIIRKVANVTHEVVAREPAMLNFPKAKFPFASQFGTGQFGHRIFQKCDSLDGFRSRLQFLALARQIMR